jgi:hypothetical protein
VADWSWLANTYGRSVIESFLKDEYPSKPTNMPGRAHFTMKRQQQHTIKAHLLEPTLDA